MSKFKKIDKEFCLTDNSVNVYGYRLLTEGLKLDHYKKNPIGFLMHDRDGGVVCKWGDFRIEGDKLFGKPTINLSHPKGQDIADQIENGFINAASCGSIVCLAATDDAALQMEGQTGPTVTEWYPREISFCDIPGNHNALACLYDIHDHELNLADFVKSKNPNMSKVLLTAAMLTALNLTDKSSESDAEKAFADLVDKAGKVEGLEKDLADTKGTLTAKEKELKDLQEATVTKEVKDLLDAGVEAGKLTVEASNKLKETYAANPKGLKDLIDVMPAQVKVTDADKEKSDFADLAAKVSGKTYHELFVSGDLEAVKNNLPDLFAKLEKENSTKK